MERIRNIDNDDNEAVDGTDKLITQSSSQQNSPLIKNQQNKQFLRAPPTPPLPPSQPPTNIPQSSLHSQQQNTYYSFKYPQNVARQYKIGKVQQFSDEEEEEELEELKVVGWECLDRREFHSWLSLQVFVFFSVVTSF
uniref:Uncharacterized protein n=1 Tax=Meloidogyne enterolobii TaxID=390850 RepID=A0A6V7XB37_MELEN|nr:unnamed protein product [Meloidogyne enterolobii]